jgi:hypothetical protein
LDWIVEKTDINDVNEKAKERKRRGGGEGQIRTRKKVQENE